MRWFTFALVLALAATSAQARIYKWIMPDGTVKYSDRPQEQGAKEVELPPLVTYTPRPVPEQAPQQPVESAPTSNGYDRFAISSPANDATVRDNAGNVTLNFAITPSLIQGHAIDIFMDGQKFGQSSLSIVTLSNVSRGTHQIYAAIVDDTGAELARTETITVHLQRASVAGGGRGAPVVGPGGAAGPGGPASGGGAGGRSPP